MSFIKPDELDEQLGGPIEHRINWRGIQRPSYNWPVDATPQEFQKENSYVVPAYDPSLRHIATCLEISDIAIMSRKFLFKLKNLVNKFIKKNGKGCIYTIRRNPRCQFYIAYELAHYPTWVLCLLRQDPDIRQAISAASKPAPKSLLEPPLPPHQPPMQVTRETTWDVPRRQQARDGDSQPEYPYAPSSDDDMYIGIEMDDDCQEFVSPSPGWELM